MRRTNRTTSSTPESRKKANQKIKENRIMQLKALKTKVYKSGFENGKPIDFMDKKTKRGTITSLD